MALNINWPQLMKTARSMLLVVTIAADNILGVSAADAEIWRLAGMYTFGGMFKVTGLYDNTDVNGDDRNAWSLGGAFMTGPHTIGLEYASADDISNTPGVDTGADIWSLVYLRLSKRTMLHARYSAISNDKSAPQSTSTTTR